MSREPEKKSQTCSSHETFKLKYKSIFSGDGVKKRWQKWIKKKREMWKCFAPLWWIVYHSDSDYTKMILFLLWPLFMLISKQNTLRNWHSRRFCLLNEWVSEEQGKSMDSKLVETFFLLPCFRYYWIDLIQAPVIDSLLFIPLCIQITITKWNN